MGIVGSVGAYPHGVESSFASKVPAGVVVGPPRPSFVLLASGPGPILGVNCPFCWGPMEVNWGVESHMPLQEESKSPIK